MAIVSICAGILGLLLVTLVGGFWMYILGMLCGLIGFVFARKLIQDAQEEGESPGLGYVGAVVSVAAMLIGAILNISTSCGR